jgi:hypothetical protein
VSGINVRRVVSIDREYRSLGAVVIDLYPGAEPEHMDLGTLNDADRHFWNEVVEVGDVIEYETEYNNYTSYDYRIYAHEPRRLAARLDRIEKILGLPQIK